MASGVNVKFVVLLAGALVLVAGGAVLAWNTVLTTSGEEHIAMGDRLAAEGRWADASRSYANAVRDDQTNMEWAGKWMSALKKLAPETRTNYFDVYRTQFIPLHRQIALAKRTDLAAIDDYLSLMFKQFGASANRDIVGIMTREVGAVLAPLEAMGSSADPAWHRLRRYRAIPMSRLASVVGSVTPDERAAAEADLLATLAVDPGDGEAATALIGFDLLDLGDARRSGNDIRAERVLAQVNERFDALRAADAGSVWHALFRLSFDLDEARRAANLEGLPIEEQAARMGEIFDPFLARLDEAAELVRAAPIEDAPLWLVERLALIEAVVVRRDFPRFERVLRDRVEKAPDDTMAKLRLATFLGDQTNRAEEAVAILEEIEALPLLPMSLAGLERLEAQAQAPRWAADFLLRRPLAASSPTGYEAEIAKAKAARDRFAKVVAETDASLILIDGMIAESEGRYEQALERYTVHNAQAQGTITRGLFLEARMARRLDRWGVAETRARELLRQTPNNSAALFILSEVEQQKNRLDEAITLMARAVALSPDEPGFAARLQALRLLAGQAVSDDPVDNVILASMRAIRGTAEQPGNATEAERILREALEPTGYAPRIVRELAARMMNDDRFPQARVLVSEAITRHPDDESLKQIQTLLEQTNPTDAALAMIEQSEASEAQKAIQRYSVLVRGGRIEEAETQIKRAAELEPDNALVVDNLFAFMVQRGDINAVRELAKRGEALNADGVGGLTFRARLAGMEGDTEEATEALEEATSRAPGNPSMWRLLGLQRAGTGNFRGAAEAFKKSLDIQPDQPGAIVQYVASLVGSGNAAEALVEARRLRPFADGTPAFENIHMALEAEYGGDSGRQLAIDRRTALATRRPEDMENKQALAGLFILAKRWDEAKALLDELTAKGKTLALVELRAKFFADQGRVRTDDGFVDGLELARREFVDFIVEQGPEKVGVQAYLSLARFMVTRGQYTLALRAIEDAKPLQDPKVREADRLEGDLMLTLDRRAEAAAAFRRVVDGGADDAGQGYRLRLIEMLLGLEEYKAAKEQLDQMPEAMRGDLTIMLQSADAAQGLGDSAAAMKFVNDAIEKHKDNSLPWTKRAQMLSADERRLGDAIADLDEALRIEPGAWRSFRLRSALYFRQGRSTEGIKDLREVIRLNPALDEVLFGLLIELIRAGRDGEALDAATEVIDRRPTDTTLMINCAQIFAERELWGRAAILVQRAWAIRQNLDVGLLYIDALVNADPPRADEADRVIERLTQLGTDAQTTPQVLVAQALIASSRDQTARAAELMQRAFGAIEGDPGEVVNWARNLPRVFGDDAVGMIADFVSRMRDGLAPADPKRPWLTFVLGRTLSLDATRSAEGVDMLRSLAADETLDDTIRLLAFRTCGAALYEAKQYPEAVDVWRTAVTVYPKDWESLNNLSYTLASKLDKAAEAVEIGERAVEAAPQNSQVYDTLAEALLALDRVDEAASRLDEAERYVTSTVARLNVELKRGRIAVRRGGCELAVQKLAAVENQLQTLPQLQERFAEDVKTLKDEIAADCAEASRQP